MGRLGNWASEREGALLAWEDEKPRRAGRACYHAYSRLFIPFAIIVLIGLPLGGRELIWNVDGLGQYYPFFIYEGQWIRGMVANLFGGDGFVVPLWEWCSGYGVDIPTTFDVFLDPLNLVSAITPVAVSEWVFQLLVVVRLYLAGLAFVFYCRTRGENRTGTVLGALLYALCGAGLTVVQWTSGLHALILFPVVLAGAERILAHDRPWVFIASLTLLAVVSYYFVYMACMLLVGYLALRVVMVERPGLTCRRFLSWTGVFAGLVLLCLVLSGFVLIPSVLALTGMDRVTGQAVAVPILYAPDYYLRVASIFLSTTEVGSDMFLGFGGLAFLGCLALFSDRGSNRELKGVFVVLTLFLLLPFVGSLFNGLNYATNRWAWAYALCVAFILTRMTPQLLVLDARRRRVMVVGTAVYSMLLLLPSVRTEANVAGFAALLATLAILLVVGEGASRRGALLGALALSLAVNGFYFLSAGEGGHGKMQTPLAAAYTKLTSGSVDSVALDAGDDSWWRYDAAQVSMDAHAPMNRIPNNSLVLGLHGIDFYNSVYDSDVDAFHTELAVAGDDINFRYMNLQGRTDLMALLGVRYYAYRADGTDAVPYGFSEDEVARRMVLGVDYRLLPADASLPMGYCLDKAITRDEYLNLSPLQRQQALLQAVVLEEASTDPDAGARQVDAAQLGFGDQEVPFTVAATSGVTVEDGRFIVQEAGASVAFDLDGTAAADTYLYVTGFRFRGMKPSELVPEERMAGATWYQRADLWVQDLSYEVPPTYEVAARSDVSSMTGYITNCAPYFHMYGGKDTWLVNLGYAEDAARSVTLTFSHPGEYSFTDLRMLTETHDQLAGWMSDRSRTVLENMELGRNRLSGTVDLDTPQTLLITTAHGDGWTAYVDGEPAELLRAETAFMGLDLTAGHHEVELRYLTPGLKAGFASTGVGAIVLILLVAVLGKGRRRTSPSSRRPHDTIREPSDDPAMPSQGTEGGRS